jgi:ketose-bisphosphate aldolase
MTPDTSVRDIMLAARDRHLLVPAFNIAYLPMVEPICRTLAEQDCFALLEVARPDIERFGAQSLAAVAEEFRKHADPRYARLHLDHVPVIDEEGRHVDWRAMLAEGLRLDYHSVMVDGSRLPLEENIAVTREVVAMAAGYGAAVEAELGAVFGHESGPLPDYETLLATGQGFTSAEEARRFVAETGVDWLSVAAGNIHGALVGARSRAPKLTARLDIPRLQALHEATGVPLVLHGGSGIAPESLLQAAQHGVTKLNIGTDIRQPYQRVVEETGDIQKAQQAVAEVVRELVADRLHLRGLAMLLLR